MTLQFNIIYINGNDTSIAEYFPFHYFRFKVLYKRRKALSPMRWIVIPPI